jgi:hypothetical protein
MDLSGRVRLLVNRYAKRSALLPSEIEQIVGSAGDDDVSQRLCARDAGDHEGAVDPNSELGRAHAQLAAT